MGSTSRVSWELTVEGKRLSVGLGGAILYQSHSVSIRPEQAGFTGSRAVPDISGSLQGLPNDRPVIHNL